MNFIEELTWRGMIHTVMPGTEEQLKKEITTAYVGIDPTADSLHIGHLVSVMMLKHLQRAGHKPIALIGGATGMIGDPSLKSQERNLLDEFTLLKNQNAIKEQLKKFLIFSNYNLILEKIPDKEKVSGEEAKGNIDKARRDISVLYRFRNTNENKTKRNNEERIKFLTSNFDITKKELENLVNEPKNIAELVNNYDWLKDYSFLNFIRDIGKHITVNYMMSKDSVRKRLSAESSEGMSFTEFSYQLLQGYDFLYLHEKKNCKLQMGGSDQWGNITTGTDLIRRKNGGDAFGLVCPLITKADGGKFGKTESGNVWLERRYTSPYKFYQFWLNVSDEDAEKYIKIFTSISKGEIESLVSQHAETPHLRALQKRLAKEVTIMVHSEEDYNAAVEASNILFGNATAEALKNLDEETLLAVFDGVPQFEISRSDVAEGVKLMELLTDKAAVFPSKGELRKTIQASGLSINKEKIENQDTLMDNSFLLNNKYILAQKGKKNYFLLIVK